ncbi:helix-turn-helix domain-containing protein [Streptomyces sp. NPDC087263]|uniref:helix-turn-helix domain-containing protein n=1 Tax=Streptomyces sp. NPDC087263 TaxID=3365773 RepID=UPI0038269442
MDASEGSQGPGGQDPGPLGEYLRARRAQLHPAEFGLPDLSRRRVPGLRRPEVALLAGISTEYYIRLEQGRDRHPSAQVVDALTGAMRLDADAAAHLHRLAAHTPLRRRPFGTEPVPSGIRQLVASWTMSPALVIGPVGDVRVANPPAQALSPAHREGVNLLRETFLNPAVRDLHRDWDDLTVSLTAGLRSYAGTSADDPRLEALVGELSVHSETFRRLWARHDVRPRSGGTALIDHPQLGPLDLRLEKLAVAGSSGLMLLVYHAEPDSPSAHGLALLGSLADHQKVPQGRAPAQGNWML